MSSVTISARGEQRIRAGHPWIYRADVVDVSASSAHHALKPRTFSSGIPRAAHCAWLARVTSPSWSVGNSHVS